MNRDKNSDKIVQLTDLLSSYGSINEPHFQGKISGLDEFSSLASSVKEAPPKPGKYFRHQRFTHRYLEHYDDLLILSETGTGKTCEIVGFLEMTRKFFGKKDISIEKEGIAHFKKVYIFVANKTQKYELSKQIVCRCTDGHYVGEELARANTEPTQKAAVTRVLQAAGYVIKTYSGATNMINQTRVNQATGKIEFSFEDPRVQQQLHDMFDDSVIWVDEAHNLISEIEGETEKDKPKEGKGNPAKEETYEALWEVFHLAKRIKRILSTATPMINDVSEIGRLLNLILPIDLQFPQGFPFETATLEELEPYFRGRINFVRAAETGAVPLYNGYHIDYVHHNNEGDFNSQVIALPAIMSQFQYEGYLAARNFEGGRGGLRPNESQAANFVFPDGIWGSGLAKAAEEEEAHEIGRPIVQFGQDKRKGGFKKYFTDGRANADFFNAVGRAQINGIDDVLGKIRTLSAKYYNVCNLVSNLPGICFVFDEKVSGSGLLALAGCLDALGFDKYDGRESIFLGANEGLKPYCNTSGNTTDRTIRRDFPSTLAGSAPRYAMITQETAGYSDKILEAVNCYENRHGNYIKVLLCSKVAREGISVNNVQQIHIMSSSWNQSNNLQALARGLRATSHVDLLEEERRKYPPEMHDKVKVDVRIFNHVALPPHANIEAMSKEKTIRQVDYLVDPEEEIDEYDDVPLVNKSIMIDVALFMIAERKDIAIKQVMRKLKQTSVACNVHYKRNVRDTDVDYSPACDYQECHYPCFDKMPDKIESGNFDLLYSDDIIAHAKQEIFRYLREFERFSFDDLRLALHEYRPIQLANALEDIVTKKEEIRDKFGYTCFLREDKGSFYLDRFYPAGKPDFVMSYYTEGLIAVEPISLSSIVKDMESNDGVNLIPILKATPVYSEQFSYLLHTASNSALVVVLEDALSERIAGRETEYTRRIIDHFFKWVVFKFPRPEQSLEEVLAKKRKVKRGPKPKEQSKIKSTIFRNGIEVVMEEDTPMIYAHNLEGNGGSLTKFNVVANFNKAAGVLRVFETDLPEVGWRNVSNEAERDVYNAIIQKEFRERKEPYERRKIYGTIDFQGVFRIRNADLDNLEKEDIRDIFRGKVCNGWNGIRYYELLWALKYYPPGRRGVVPINELLREYNMAGQFHGLFADTNEIIQDQEKASHFYFWLKYDETRANICEMLKNSFRSEGRLLEFFPEN